MNTTTLRHAPLVGALVVLLPLGSPASSLASTMYSQEQSGSVAFPDFTPVVLTFTDAPAAATDATLSLLADGGELANNNKRLEQLSVEGTTYQTPGSPSGWIRPVNFLDDQNLTPDPVTIPLADLTGFVADGQVEVTVVRPSFIAGGTFRVLLEYTAIPEPTSTAMAIIAGIGFCAWRRR